MVGLGIFLNGKLLNKKEIMAKNKIVKQGMIKFKGFINKSLQILKIESFLKRKIIINIG